MRLEWRDPSELEDNPANWRTHPATQAGAFDALLKQVGWAGALLLNEATGRLIDGHLRKRSGSEKVPVLIGSWTEEQERLILASLDPLGAMAEANSQKLSALLSELEATAPDLEDLMSRLQSQAVVPAPKEKAQPWFNTMQELQPMAWVLIGIPILEFGQIAATVEEIAARPGIICEIAPTLTAPTMHKSDNSNFLVKLELRRRFLRQYHSTGANVFDCCQGSGKIWGTLRQEFTLEAYWGVDLEPKAGRLKIDSTRILAAPGWPFDVIDIDTYGKPWAQWEALLPHVTRPTSVIMTWGQLGFTALEHDSFAVLGIPFPIPVAVGFGHNLVELAARARVFLSAQGGVWAEG